MEPLDTAVDHMRGGAGRAACLSIRPTTSARTRVTPTLFIDGVVYRGDDDTRSLLEALER